MCIILAGEEPDTTKLINIPVIYDNKNYNLCLYINNLDIDNKNTLMVVPFPKVDGVPIGMVDLNTDQMKDFRQKVSSMFPRRITYGRSSLGASFESDSSNSPLKVFTVGHYKISIAPTIDALLRRVDWTRFHKPFDFSQRVETMKNYRLYPYDCIYVVAQATVSIKDDGFGIMYPYAGLAYFPTAHEEKSSMMGIGSDDGRTNYDVECYHFNNTCGSQFMFAGSPHEIHNVEGDVVHNILKRLPTDVQLENGIRGVFKLPKLDRLSMWGLSGYMQNSNIYMKC